MLPTHFASKQDMLINAQRIEELRLCHNDILKAVHKVNNRLASIGAKFDLVFFFFWFLKILLTQEHITKLNHIKNIYTITQKENIYNIKITRTYVNMYMLFYSIICCFYGMSF
jgi:hypothetical protein